MRTVYAIAVILTLALGNLYLGWENEAQGAVAQDAGIGTGEILGKDAATDTSMVSYGYVPSEKTAAAEALFCRTTNCTYAFLELIRASEDIRCALYDLDLPEVISALGMKNAFVVVDRHCFDEIEGMDPGISRLRAGSGSGLMHDKFCVFDRMVVMTGSWNPTFNGAYRNDNNVIVVRSGHLAENYLDEWGELWNSSAGRDSHARYSAIDLNGKMYENYFCPEDGCREKVMDALDDAGESILFMAFSFTDRGIAHLLLDKSKNIKVMGVMEKQRTGSRYSVYPLLEGLAQQDRNPWVMHHKVFIIDGETVVTGSYNPTKGGDTANDENLLIIHDPAIASAFQEEFRRVRGNDR